MDEFERTALNAAVAAHCEWLESQGVIFPTKPNELETSTVLSAMPEAQVPSFPTGGYYRLQLARCRLRHKQRKARPWTKSRRLSLRDRKPRQPKARRVLVDIVLRSLNRLCALRTLDRLGDIRQRKRDEAMARVAAATEGERQASLAHVESVHDDEHLEHVEAPLEQLQQRLRTACKRLSEFLEVQASRHATFVARGLERFSAAPKEIAMAQWLVVRAERLDQNVGAFRQYIQGPAAEPLSGHVGAADGKAWHRLQGDVKLWFKHAGAPSSLGRTLFPDPVHTRAVNMDAKRRAQKRDVKAVNRAKRRASSKA
jgi:hypothetical protein